MSALAVAFSSVLLASPALFGPEIDADDNSFVVSVDESANPDPAATTQNSGSLGEYHQQPACESVCTGDLTCPDGTFKMHSWYVLPTGEIVNEAYWCPTEAAQPEVTDGLVATAFRRIPLPPSSFQVQPPGGRTLVNFETNFFADTDRELDRTVRLLGQRVDLRIEAHSYTWHFDDGDSVTTTKPGAPYPRLQITHNYLSKGSYRPTLDITWVADYRVDGGPWRPVPGSVTIAGAPTPLRAVEARPTLVGYER